MPEADVIDNAAVMQALKDVSTAVTSMRADIDALKTPKGRTEADVIDLERIERENAAAGAAQDVLDKARRARGNAKKLIEDLKAARGERPIAGRILRPGRGAPMNHLTGEPLTDEQITARADYRKHFMGWLRSGNGNDIITTAPKAAMQTQIGEKGGFLVPFEMENAVIQLGGLYSAMRSLADVRTIAQGNSIKQPANIQGATFGWTGELATRTETATDDISMLEWFLMECYAQPKVTNILLQDAAFDVESWLNDGISREFAEGEGVAFISGSGTNQPRGIQSYTTVANASWAWNKIGYIVTGVAAALTDSTHNGFDALIDTVTALHRRYLPGAAWLSNRTVQSVLRKVKDTTGQYIWQQSLTADQPSTILGYPSETDDNMPSEGANNFPLMFGDYAQAYRIVDKAGMQMLRDEVTDKGRTIFYTTKRTGGGVKNFEAVKFVKCST
jgi:HK97 family phage major capsid protein